MKQNRIWLHRYAIAVVLAAAALIVTGSIVTTLGAGLAVPDWPLSFGSLNPDGWWQRVDVRAEHGHRLVAGAVGLMTLVLCIWIFLADRRRSVRLLAVFTVLAVVVQAVLGGLRVIDQNVTLAMVHAAMAQGLFAALVVIAWLLSRDWRREVSGDVSGAANPWLTRCAMALVVVVYLQLVIGAVMRHSYAGMAIPTWPLTNGGLLPETWSFPVTIHFLHRLGGALVLLLAIGLVVLERQASLDHRGRLTLWLTAGLILLQVLMGGAVILFQRQLVPTSFHVVLGAATLAAAVTAGMWLARQEAATQQAA